LRKDIVDALWEDREDPPNPDNINVHLCRLRKILKALDAPFEIETMGYSKGPGSELANSLILRKVK
jgi:DNA-binding SARP family transcriptional activator